MALATTVLAALTAVTGCAGSGAGGVRASRVVLAPDVPDTAGAPARSVTAVTITRAVPPETAAWLGGVARYPSR
ncbi:hypothetical protein M2266_000377 [Streptomyces sp. SPB162]|nr:hypothetical protein [Streptomyces sp. SPB162]